MLRFLKIAVPVFLIGFLAGIIVTGNVALLQVPLDMVLAPALGAAIGAVVAEFALLVRGR